MGGNKKCAKSGKGVRAMQAKSATAWDLHKRKKAACFSDLPMGLVVASLSFLTKRAGNATYTHGKGLLHLNTVCRQWFYHLERQRTTIPRSMGSDELLHLWAVEKAAHLASPSLSSGTRSPQAISPAAAPEDGGQGRPQVLVLSELAHPMPRLPSGDDTDSSAAQDHHPEKVTDACAKAALRRVAAGVNGKRDAMHLLLRLFRFNRTLLSEKIAFVRSDMAPRKAEAQKALDLIKWGVRDLGLDVNATDAQQRTLLHHACLCRDTACAKFLLQAGADIAATDRRRATPLHYAAGGGCPEITQLLVCREDAAVHQCIVKRDSSGLTPLEIASRGKHTLCMQIVSKKQRTLLSACDRHDPGDDEDAMTHEQSSSSFSENAESVQSTPEKKPLPDAQGQAKGAGCAKAAAGARPKAHPKKKAAFFDAADERAFAYEDRHR